MSNTITDHPLLSVESIDQSPDTYLNSIGCVFKVFDHNTQDSGNISYGIRINQERYFVKTAGYPDDRKRPPKHPERISLLQNAVSLWRSCNHQSLPHLYHVIESPYGPMLVYQWVNGELIRTESSKRNEPKSSFQSFRRLPVPEIIHVLDVIYELHYELAQLGWIAVDFYDGCMIYDFERQKLHLVDLDMYHKGKFRNNMGRMYGSSRFMAPEEFELGAVINECTNVFTMGRTAVVLLSDGTLERSPFRGSDVLYEVIIQACQNDRSKRFDSMAAFYTAWQEARLVE